MSWLDSCGGPLIFSCRESARDWMGTLGNSMGTGSSDYDRACEVYGYTAVIPCWAREVAVLGDEPMSSKLFVAQKSIFIARWICCGSAELAADVLARLPDALPAVAPEIFIRLIDGDVVLFDSALSFAEIDEAACATLARDNYRMTTEALDNPQAKYSFIIHRLTRVA